MRVTIVGIYLIPIFVSISPLPTILNQNEFELSLRLVKELEIRQCILVRGINDSAISEVKKFSSEKLQLTSLNYTKLLDAIIGIENYPWNIGVILKEKNLSNLKVLLGTLRQSDQLYKISQLTWIVFVQKGQQYEDLTIPYNCQFVLIESENEKNYKLTEIYSVNKDFYSNDFGIWDKKFGLKLTNVTYMYWRRFNMQRSSITIDFPYKEFNSQLFKTNYIKDIIIWILEIMNFEIYVRDYNADPNLKSRKTSPDIIAKAEPFHSASFHKYKIGPLFKLTMNWYIKLPPEKLHPDYYLQVFDYNIWLCVMSLIIIGAALLLFINALIDDEDRYPVDNIFMILESFCNQCGNGKIKNHSLRIVCVTVRITVIVLFAHYAANVTSDISYKEPDIPFSSPEDFLENGQYQLQTPFNEILHLDLKKTKNPALQKLYSKYTVLFDADNQEFIEKICYEKKAMDYFLSATYNIKLPCNVYQIQKPIMTFWAVVLLKENSPFMQIFNHQLLIFWRSGIQQRLQKLVNYYFTLKTNKEFERLIFRPADVKTVFQVLLIPFVGVILGVVILTVEFMHHYCSMILRNGS